MAGDTSKEAQLCGGGSSREQDDGRDERRPESHLPLS